MNGRTFLSLIPKWFDCSICRIIKCFEWSLFRGKYSSVILIWLIWGIDMILCAATIPLVWMTIWRSRWTISDKHHCGFKLVYLRIADAQEFLRNVLEPEVHLVVHKHIYCCLNFSCAWLPAFSNQQQRVSSVLSNWLIRAYFLNVEVAYLWTWTLVVKGEIKRLSCKPSGSPCGSLSHLYWYSDCHAFRKCCTISVDLIGKTSWPYF